MQLFIYMHIIYSNIHIYSELCHISLQCQAAMAGPGQACQPWRKAEGSVSILVGITSYISVLYPCYMRNARNARNAWNANARMPECRNAICRNAWNACPAWNASCEECLLENAARMIMSFTRL